jgi:hypothetical protein
MKLLFTVPWPGQSLYSNKPIKTPADFAGTKMRAYNPATTRIAQLLKAQPVTIQLAELGQALATGGGQQLPHLQRQRRGEQAVRAGQVLLPGQRLAAAQCHGGEPEGL